MPITYKMPRLFALILIAAGVALACDHGDPDPSLIPSGVGHTATPLAIHGDYLYMVVDDGVRVYDAASGATDALSNDYFGNYYRSVTVEGDYLYAGYLGGTDIFSLDDPVHPTLTFYEVGITACDALVIQDQRAFVARRTGTTCSENENTNALMVYDVTDGQVSELIFESSSVSSPYALAVEGSLLYVADGSAGFKVFNIDQSGSLSLVFSSNAHPAYDIGVDSGVIRVTAKDGIYQYALTLPGGLLQQLSVIPVTTENV